MKIAVYSIAKDEERVAQRFADSVKDADYKLVVDTGSTDDTVRILRRNGIMVVEERLKPFRFDVARNLSLSGLPPDIDIAVALDLDDVLVDGWRDIIEKHWVDGLTRLFYLYPLYPYDNFDKHSVVLRGFKVHHPRLYTWVDPIHEWLKPIDDSNDRYKFVEDVIVKHFPYRKESREDRLYLFGIGIKENVVLLWGGAFKEKELC